MDFLADSKRLAQLGLTILDDPPDICDYARHASAQNNTLNTAVPVPNSRAYSALSRRRDNADCSDVGVIPT
jgi:hypothetical protein